MKRADFYLCRLALVAGLAFAVVLLCVANPSLIKPIKSVYRHVPAKIGVVVRQSFPTYLNQLQVSVSEVNDVCGTATVQGIGAFIECLEEAEAAAAGLLANGVSFIVEALGTTHAIISAPPAVQAEVPYGLAAATFDGLSGCTDDQLVDPEITKSDFPTAMPGDCWDTGGLG